MPITLDDIKNMPLKRKAIIIVVFFILIGYFYYFFFLQELYEKKAGLESNLSTLKEQIAAKQLLVREIQESKKALVALRESFNLALTKLPNRKEIPGLLTSMALAGRSSGLDFIRFEPIPPPKPAETKPGTKKQAASRTVEEEKFYDEIPLKVILSGGFHDMVSFFESVGKLDRIVNITDIKLEADKSAKEEGRLISTCTMKTYLFVDKSHAKAD
jgi:type IV pilus assembly protein PilO